MRKLTAFGMLCLFLLTKTMAADGDYAVNRIPAFLRMNANVVKRFEHRQFTVKNAGEAFYKIKYVLTILNENGDDYAAFSQYYNKFYEIRSIEGKLYDAYGKELRKVKNKDIRDWSGVDENSLIDDNRFKSHNFYYKAYPYTISYEVELKYNGTMFYPEWFPQARSLMAVEESRFTFSCPDNFEFRYKAYQYDPEPRITKEKGVNLYDWQIKNLPAIYREPYSPSLRKITPLVLFGPSEFGIQDYKGSMKSWEDLGKFFYLLNRSRDVLPDDVKQTVQQLTGNIADPLQKVKLLYEYLQKNTRYISIQLGIGGWQPFDARFVATKKYGDCKALTNYMFSLLKEAGIQSRYTLVMAGDNEEDIFPDFPSGQFNHVILCVPLAKDTIWLECTDQFGSPGYMGSFTGNRYVLIVDEKGGSLIRTPRYGMQENLQVRNIKAVLDVDASLQVKVTSHYSGIQQDNLHRSLSRLSKDKMKERLREKLDFATYDVNQFEYSEQKKSIPAIDEMLNLSVSNYATITGKRLFIVPNVMTRSQLKLNADTMRKYDIELKYEYRDTDTAEIELPMGYVPESMPKDVSIKTRFGNYSSSIKLLGNKLYYYRSVEQFSGRFPANDYEELVQFYETIYKTDRGRVVLVKN